MDTDEYYRTPWRVSRKIFFYVVITIIFAACATKTSNTFIHAKYDFSLIQKIAVLPLENLSADQLAAERVRKIVVSELLAVRVLDVVEPGQVNRALSERQIQVVNAMSPQQYAEVGKSLGVQAFVLGSVDVYDRINVGGTNFAEVAITLRAIDSATGTIIWSTSKSAGGVGVVGRLFGFGGDTMNEATQKAVRAAVLTLFQ